MFWKPLNKLFMALEHGKNDRLHYYPRKISVETGNICNLQCPLCPTHKTENRNIKKGMLTLADFKVIFDKISPFVTTVDLFNWGEPFLNKETGLFVKYIKEKKPGTRVFIDSNFNIASDEQIDQIVRYGLDSLNVSCDGLSQDVYAQYRRNGNIEAVFANIGKLVAKKRELGLSAPRIIWKYLVFKHNQHEVNAARDKAAELGIDFSASGMRIDCGKELFEKIEISIDRDKRWIPDMERYNNYLDMNKKRSFCPKPWKTVSVNFNGDVVPCGAIYDCEKYRFGNLLTQSFDEIWNGPLYRQARRIVLGRSEDREVICGTCKSNGYPFL